MCAIFGSFEVNKLKELALLNSYRGERSFSISEYSPNTKKLLTKQKCMGRFSLDNVELTAGMYYVAHIQAPTTEASAIESIHPSDRNDGHDLLWHNGILKENFVEEMQSALSSDLKWDTGLLHDWLIEDKSLNDVDGTFACLRYVDGDIKLFRNEISPLFVDSKLNISSTKFPGAEPLIPNKIWTLDFKEYIMNEGPSFTTKENPYYFG
tara:strand:- start:22938 stop:23564 length:627 start_codon:yes stop_codon:yes gene_type:complete